MTEKACKRCGQTYPLTPDGYPREKRNLDGYSGTCRVCTRALAMARYDRNLAARGKVKQQRGNQPIERVEYMRKWRANNRQKVRDYWHRWRSEQKRQRYAQLMGVNL